MYDNRRLFAAAQTVAAAGVAGRLHYLADTPAALAPHARTGLLIAMVIAMCATATAYCHTVGLLQARASVLELAAAFYAGCAVMVGVSSAHRCWSDQLTTTGVLALLAAGTVAGWVAEYKPFHTPWEA